VCSLSFAAIHFAPSQVHGRALLNYCMGARPMAPAVERAGFAIGSYLRDGMNTRAYLRGHLVDGSDPEGLFFGLAFQMATTAVDAYDTATGAMEEAAQGFNTYFGLTSLLEDAQFMQIMDLDWAMDWSQDDNYMLWGTGYPGTPGADLAGGERAQDGPAMAGMGKKGGNKAAKFAAAKARAVAKKAGGFAKRVEAAKAAAGKVRANAAATAVERGQAPRSINRIDKGNADAGEYAHAHFDNNTHALNSNGQWKHRGRALTGAEKDFLSFYGWKLPP